ncbi:MAG: hypothetical protein IPH57_01545 [Saprospiraceae bacterium]|nr:hypothetical protein [Saprospiraceae bacterium]
MILILGEKKNNTISKVISFITKVKFKRFNDELTIDFIQIGNDVNNELENNFDSYTKIWYIRSYLKLTESQINDKITATEYSLYLEYILHQYKGKIIGSYNVFFHQNTLIQLAEAENIGLTIPKTIISNTLPDFGDRKIINKIIGTTKSFSTKDFIYTTTGTQFVKKDEYIENGHLNFFQEFIEKKFEIRVFYFLGSFFPMAIFSQRDEKTKVDYRNYNDEKPNRTIPFKLPFDIQNKLTLLIKNLELNTGSIDMIYSKTGKFVFLEINPCGIFDWLSSNCNYYIERHIAKCLENG